MSELDGLDPLAEELAKLLTVPMLVETAVKEIGPLLKAKNHRAAIDKASSTLKDIEGELASSVVREEIEKAAAYGFMKLYLGRVGAYMGLYAANKDKGMLRLALQDVEKATYYASLVPPDKLRTSQVPFQLQAARDMIKRELGLV